MKKIYLLFIFSTLIWIGLPAQSTTSGYTFLVNGGLVNPESQLVAALRQFEEVFGYRDGSGLITSNEEVCDCPNYLKDKQASFAAQGGLQFFAQGIDGVIYIREGQVKGKPPRNPILRKISRHLILGGTKTEKDVNE